MLRASEQAVLRLMEKVRQLDGAAALVSSDAEVISMIDDVWSNSSRRAIMIAAGRARAIDFAPATAARAYVALYRDVVRGWSA